MVSRGRMSANPTHLEADLRRVLRAWDDGMVDGFRCLELVKAAEIDNDMAAKVLDGLMAGRASGRGPRLWS